MHEQDLQTAGKFSPFTTPHSFNFLSQVNRVKSMPCTVTQQPSLLLCPGIEVGIVQVFKHGSGNLKAGDKTCSLLLAEYLRPADYKSANTLCYTRVVGF
jgi:hypothetical protein